MKEQWKFDDFAKILSKVEGDRNAPVQVDLPHDVLVQSNNNCSNKIVILLKILILTAGLTLLSWLSIRFYSDYITFPSLSKYSFQDKTWEIIIDENPKEFHDWAQEVNDDLFTATDKNKQQSDISGNNYEVATFFRKPNEIKATKYEEEFIQKIISIFILIGTQSAELNLALTGAISLLKSLNILENHSLYLTRNMWICKLLQNETEDTRTDILEFVNASEPHFVVWEEKRNCTEVADNNKNSSDETDVSLKSSVIVDSDANLLFVKHLERRVDDIYKLLLWYLDNHDSEYYKNSEKDVKVLTAKILFDTDIKKYRETLDQLRTIIEGDKNYENDYEKVLNGTLKNFVADTTFEIIMTNILYMKAAAERLYAYNIINAETLTYVIPILRELGKDILSFDEENSENTNATTTTALAIPENVDRC